MFHQFVPKVGLEEEDAMQRVLSDCGAAPYIVSVEESAPAPADIYYTNCSVAKDAGVEPVYAGQSGYRTHLDRDGDGIGCE